MHETIINKPDQYSFIRVCGLILACLLALFYLSQVYLLSNNIPMHDDYNDSLRFMVEYLQANDPLNRAALFFEQHHEHKTLVNRLIYTLHYSVLGELNYQHILITANLFLIGMVFLHGNIFNHPLSLLTGAFLILSLTYWNASFWVITALSYFSVTFFCLSTLLLLNNETRFHFFLAMICGFLCCFSLGNGILVLALGAALIYIRQGAERTLYVWLLFSILTTILFFWDYHSSEVTRKVFFKDGRESEVQLILNDPLGFIRWYLSLIGSGFSFGNAALRPILGLIILVLCGFLAYKETKKQPVALLFCAFLLATISVAAYKRFVIEVMGIDFQNRYSFYSILLGLFLISILSQHLRRRRNISSSNYFITVVFLLSIPFNVYSWYWGKPKLEGMLNPVQENILNWLVHENPKKFFVLFADNPHEILQHSRRLSIYNPIKAIPDNQRPVKLATKGNCSANTNLDVIEEPEHSVLRLDKTIIQDSILKDFVFCMSGKKYELQYSHLPVYIPAEEIEGLKDKE